MFDLHPNSSDHERLKTNLLRSEGYTTVYQKKNRLKKISSNPRHRIAVCEQTGGGGGGGGGGRRAAAGGGGGGGGDGDNRKESRKTNT